MRHILILVLITLLSVTLVAQTTMVVQNNVPYNGAMFYSHQRNVARSSAGLLMVAWTDRSGAGGQSYYSIYDNAFQTWSPPVAFSNAADRALQPALSADESGNIHAVWQQRASSSDRYQIFYAKFNGSTWSAPRKVSVNDALPAEEATISVDSRGYLYVVYNNDGAGGGNEFLFGVRSTDGGTTWSTSVDTLSSGGTLGTSIEVARACLTAGPDGKLAAIWDNSLTGTAARRETYVNQYDGTKWQGPILISDTTIVDRDHNRYSTIAIDKQSNIYAFYGIAIISGSDPRTRYFAMHKKSWTGTWSTKPTLLVDSSSSNFSPGMSSVVDPDGIIHIVYRRDNPADTAGLDEVAYRYSANAGANWSTPRRVSRADRDARYPTIANKVRKTYGIDIAWVESRDPAITNQDTSAVMYANVPYSLVSSVVEATVPTTFTLHANYPNPFNPSTTIRYAIPAGGDYSMKLYDALGREVKTLVEGYREAGEYSVVWDGRNAASNVVPSGAYFVRLSGSTGVRTIKLMLLK
ncbi:MAG: T9SS type A sorting domain-containing protein [Ignavibacteria bacterium]|nr:T9SS type A sorting domain-containing protein [Ignavibacteria bacterium]